MSRLTPCAILMDGTLQTVVATHGPKSGDRRWVTSITILRDGEEVTLPYPSHDYEALFDITTVSAALRFAYEAGWYVGGRWIEGDIT